VILIPAYFHPLTSHFKRLISVKSSKPVIVILNVYNGPGSEVDPNYVQAVNELVDRGFIPIGYVYTNYGKRAIDVVKRDIDKWFEYYPNIK